MVAVEGVRGTDSEYVLKEKPTRFPMYWVREETLRMTSRFLPEQL